MGLGFGICCRRRVPWLPSDCGTSTWQRLVAHLQVLSAATEKKSDPTLKFGWFGWMNFMWTSWLLWIWDTDASGKLSNESLYLSPNRSDPFVYVASIIIDSEIQIVWTQFGLICSRHWCWVQDLLCCELWLQGPNIGSNCMVRRCEFQFKKSGEHVGPSHRNFTMSGWHASRFWNGDHCFSCTLMHFKSLCFDQTCEWFYKCHEAFSFDQRHFKLFEAAAWRDLEQSTSNPGAGAGLPLGWWPLRFLEIGPAWREGKGFHGLVCGCNWNQYEPMESR